MILLRMAGRPLSTSQSREREINSWDECPLSYHRLLEHLSKKGPYKLCHPISYFTNEKNLKSRVVIKLAQGQSVGIKLV